MSFTLPVGGGNGGDFKPVSPGTHLAICNIIADLGLQPGSQMYPEPKRKVYMRFEIPAERVEYTDKHGNKVEGPATIGREFTASMHEKSTLRKFIEGWRSKKFTDAEAAAFDLSKLLGMACLLNVQEDTRGDRTYSNIASASKLPTGMAPNKPENELLLFTADSPDSVYDKLPKKLKEKIDGQIRPKSEQQAMEQAAGEYDPFLDVE